VFGIHGGPGFLGLILTGVFADSSIAAMDGTVIPGGAINGHSIQIGYQVISAVVCLVYAFTVTYSLAWCFSKVPFLSLRSAEAVETKGLDQGELGEKGYQYSMANGLDNIGDGDK
jgi:Amt family ammonium transporter